MVAIRIPATLLATFAILAGAAIAKPLPTPEPIAEVTHDLEARGNKCEIWYPSVNGKTFTAGEMATVRW